MFGEWMQSPLGPMEPEILEKEMKKTKSKIWNRVTGGVSTNEFLFWLGFAVFLNYLFGLVDLAPAGI